MSALKGQADLFDLLVEWPPVTIPPFTVWTSSKDYPRKSWCCGWCGSKNLTGEGCGGGAGRGPGAGSPWYCWNYCGTCANLYGRPEPHRPGYPVTIGQPA